MTAHKRFFLCQIFIFGVLNFGTKTAAGNNPIIAGGTELEKGKPYEWSHQILGSLIKDIFDFMIAHRDFVIDHKHYLYQFDRS